MDLLKLLITLVCLFIAVWAIAKKFYPPMTLLVVSILILFGYTLITKNSVLGDKTCGNLYIDIFEYTLDRFKTAFSSNGVVLIPIFGYATYMTKLNASKLLACLAVKPLKKINSPYWVGIPLVILTGAILRLAIGSQTGLNALFMVCIYPVLLACGLSKYTAGALIILSTTFDWGPGDSPTNLIYGNVVGENVTQFFIDYQLKIYPFAILVAMILAIFVNRRADKKLGAFEEEKLEELDPKSLGIPVYYALFPLLPLIFMIVFSEAVIGSVTMSAFGATVASLLIVMIFQIINRNKVKNTINEGKEWYLGMGTGFGMMFAIISAAQVFAGALKFIGGFTVLTDWLATVNIPGALLILLVGPCATLVAIALGSSSAASTTFYPMLADLAAVAGIGVKAACVPLLTAVGPGRALSPISPSVTIVANQIDVNPIELVKRNVIPMAGYWLTASLIAIIFFG